MKSISVALTSVFFLVACGGENQLSEDQVGEILRETIESNQTRWNGASIRSYSFTYQRPPYQCPIVDPLPAAEVTVEDGVISNIYIPELDATVVVDSQYYLTIDEMFSELFNSLESIVGEPLFDETFGFPTNYIIDPSDAECDGFRVSVSSFI